MLGVVIKLLKGGIKEAREAIWILSKVTSIGSHLYSESRIRKSLVS